MTAAIMTVGALKIEKRQIAVKQKVSLEESLYQEAQVEFVDPSISERIKEFNKLIQTSTSLLSKAKDMIGRCKAMHPFIIQYDSSITEEYRLHLKTLETNKKQLKTQLGRLRETDKSTNSLFKWFAKTNKNIETGISACDFYYNKIHLIYAQDLNPIGGSEGADWVFQQIMGDPDHRFQYQVIC